MAGEHPPTTPFPREELDQLSEMCARPGWHIDGPALAWSETPAAFIKSIGVANSFGALVAIFIGPWLLAYAFVRGAVGLWRWLNTGGPPPS